MLDKFKDECGVFGIFGHPEAANLTYLGLYALQHRGQESAGIATADGARLRASRAMGQVADAFNEATLAEAARAPGDRPHPLLDGRREQARERAAVPDRLRARPDRRRRTTATSSTRASCATSWSATARSSRPAATPKSSCISTRARRRRRVEDALVESIAQVRGAYLAGAADQEPADRGARSARLPAAGARPARRRVDRLLRDLRARSDRRHLRARRRAGRGARHQRRRPAVDQAVPAAAALALRLRARLLRAARQLRVRPQRQRGPHRARPHPRARVAGRRRRRRADSRLGRLRRDRLRRGGRACRCRWG